MGRKKIVVKTSLGETELNPEDEVQVYVDGNVSVLKRAGDLRRGERVLFKRERVTTTLNDIIPLLESNPIYRHARSRVFHVYEPPREVTLLRKLLLEGVLRRGVLEDTPELRRAIILEQSDLSPSEYSLARKELESILEEQGMKPSDGTVADWINNKTVLPIKKYREGLTKVNSQLADFSDEDEKEGSRYRAYAFWRSCRQILMRRLKHGNGNNGQSQTGEKDSENGDESRKLGLVVNDVVNQVAEDYDEETSISQIVSVVRDSARGKTVEDSGIRLRGNEQPISFSQLIKDSYVLNSYSNPLISSYLRQKGFPEHQIDTIVNKVLERFADYAGRSLPPSMKNLEENAEVNESTIEQVMGDLMENVPDKWLTLPIGTTRRLIGTVVNLATMFPEDFVKWVKMGGRLSSLELEAKMKRGSSEGERVYSEFRRNVEECKRLGKRLNEKYGFDPFEFSRLTTAWRLADQFDRSLFSYTDPEKLKARLGEIARERGAVVITEQEIRDTLRRYDLEEMIETNPMNLALENERVARKMSKYLERMEEVVPHLPDSNWMKVASEKHVELVKRLSFFPEIIEEGLKLVKGEYQFEGGWARADMIFEDSNHRLLTVEVKQYATPNGNGFDNASKAVEQTAGYRSALTTKVLYHKQKCPHCPGLAGLNPVLPVRGMLVAHKIDENAKIALEKEGCEYVEVSEDFNVVERCTLNSESLKDLYNGQEEGFSSLIARLYGGIRNLFRKQKDKDSEEESDGILL